MAPPTVLSGILKKTQTSHPPAKSRLEAAYTLYRKAGVSFASCALSSRRGLVVVVVYSEERAFVRQEANRGPHVHLGGGLRAQAVGDVIERQTRALVVVVVVLGEIREELETHGASQRRQPGSARCESTHTRNWAGKSQKLWY